MSVKLRDKNNKDNEWLGPFRVGPYDLVALKYSIQICGGPQAFGGLMISHLDQLARFSNWPVCVGYEFQGKTSDLSEYFDVEKGIIVGIKLYPDTNDANQYNHQLRLTELLKSCKPIVLTLHEKEESLEETFIKKVESETKIPVVVTSYGPTKEDRRIRNGWENLFTT
jgi:adenylosuccinate synthase